MNRLLIGMVATTGLIALVTLLLWLQEQPDRPAGKEYTNLHCPECRLELTYSAAQDGKPCPQCGASGPRMVPTVGSFVSGEADRGPGRFGNFLAAFVIASALVEAALYGWVLRERARARAEEEARLRQLVCRCPFCSRKIGYPQTRIGTGAVCARCKTAFLLPDASQAELA